MKRSIIISFFLLFVAGLVKGQCVGTGCPGSSGGGGGAVSSVFTRTGAVTATTGDYTGDQIAKTVNTPGILYCPTTSYSGGIYTCSTGFSLSTVPNTGTLIVVTLVQACDTSDAGLTIDSLATKLMYVGQQPMLQGACGADNTFLFYLTKLSSSNFQIRAIAQDAIEPVCTGNAGAIIYNITGGQGCSSNFTFGVTTNTLFAKRIQNALNTVSFSATPVFDLSLGDIKITLTGNVTSSTISNGIANQIITVYICQDATGARTFVYPTAFKGGLPIVAATASTCSSQIFKSPDGTTFYAQSSGVLNQ